MLPLMAGMMASGLGLQAYGMFRKQRTAGGLPEGSILGQYDLRAGEIGEFEKKLAAARLTYQSAINNLATNTWSRFVPDTEAMFASRGFTPIGGAYQSALAKESAKLKAGMDVDLATRERQDISDVDQAKAQLRAALMGVGISRPYSDPIAQGFGNIGAGMFNLGAGSYMADKEYDRWGSRPSSNPGGGYGQYTPRSGAWAPYTKPWAPPMNKMSIY